jgi:hypothetical protein
MEQGAALCMVVVVDGMWDIYLFEDVSHIQKETGEW